MCVFGAVIRRVHRGGASFTAPRRHRSAQTEVKRKWSATILTPKTTFELAVRGDKRLRREAAVAQATDFEGVYEWQSRQARPDMFVLHDGPPYANGRPHFGHAINKVIKDFAIRYRLLRGSRIHYVPGWDCHGLPIELGVTDVSQRSYPEDPREAELTLRSRAREFAERWIAEQLAAFRCWGILADWNRPYLTLDPKFIASELDLFCTLFEKDLIFRERKPVYWSYAAKTALADAEIVYNEKHISPSVYVKFQLRKSRLLSTVSGDVDLVVWTTNPWTLPANKAVCYAPNDKYCLVRDTGIDGGLLLIGVEAKQRLEQLLSTSFTVIAEFKGEVLDDSTCVHPMTAEERPLLPSATLVSAAKGTGLVHVAPAHGPEDFVVAIENGVSTDECLVDEDLRFVADAGTHLAGRFVLTDGNRAVIRQLGRRVLHASSVEHSYPYDWRTNTPVVHRASLQWFVHTDKIKGDALRCFEEQVDVHPARAKAALVDSLRRRPYWCISRQRLWGVPIPVFYESRSKKPIFNRRILNHLLQLLQQHGSDFWWSLPMDVLLPSAVLQQCGLESSSESYERGRDILDIWFDSGSSWHHVLSDVDDRVADLCVEGVDQIGAWFQASLMTSCAIRKRAPYKSLYLHGFALDETGRKMSKSLGNVIDPQAVINGDAETRASPIGVDALRWWVAAHGSSQDNVAVARSTLDSSSDSYNKIRNTFRFLLGLLDGFDFDDGRMAVVGHLSPLDRYILHRLHRFKTQVIQLYESYSFASFSIVYMNFIVNDVSRVYCHLIKDRMYCDRRQSESRRSCQTAVDQLLNVLVETLAPVMPFLCEDVYLNHPNHAKTNTNVFRSTWTPLDDTWIDQNLEKSVSRVLEVGDSVNRVVAARRLNLRDFDAIIWAAPGGQLRRDLEFLSQVTHGYSDAPLRELLQTANVMLVDHRSSLPTADAGSRIEGVTSEDDAFSFVLSPSMGGLCERCRRRWMEPLDESCLCSRCSDVVNHVS